MQSKNYAKSIKIKKNVQKYKKKRHDKNAKMQKVIDDIMR